MTSDAAKKRKAIRDRVKGQATDDSDEYDHDGRHAEGSTFLYVLYVAALAAGLCVLLALMSVHNKAGVSGPRMEDWTSIRPPSVQEQTEHIVYRSPQDPPQPAEDKPAEAAGGSEGSSVDPAGGADPNQQKPPESADAAANAEESVIDGAGGEATSSRAEAGDQANIEPANAAPAEALSVAPDPSERVQEPLQYVPIPIDTVQLEGSEPTVESLPPHQPEKAVHQEMVQEEVRVRQVIQRKIHEDGSVTEEVVAEYVLKPGDEGYDDLGKDPVTVSHGSANPSAEKPESQATVQA